MFDVETDPAIDSPGMMASGKACHHVAATDQREIYPAKIAHEPSTGLLLDSMPNLFS